jgi:MFS transporter, PHS family, inorganic phosphate transporter
MGKTWDQIKFLAVAGIGLFGDGYLNITIGLVVPIIGYLYFEDTKNTVPTVQQDVIKGALSLGMIVGQIGFGLFGDALGRHKIYGKELIITLLGNFLLIMMPWKNFGHGDVVAWMFVFRFVTGMGIGGDYPMTSSISAENERFGSRAKLVLTVFASIGLGGTTGALVFLILIAAFKNSINENTYHLQWVWRLQFGLGLIPLAATLYARLTMKESKPYEKYVAKETGLVGKDRRGLRQQFKDFNEYFSDWKHARTLFAVCAAWFLL